MTSAPDLANLCFFIPRSTFATAILFQLSVIIITDKCVNIVENNFTLPTTCPQIKASHSKMLKVKFSFVDSSLTDGSDGVVPLKRLIEVCEKLFLFFCQKASAAAAANGFNQSAREGKLFK